MSDPAHLGDALGMFARMFPDKLAARDLERAMTFRVWNERACRLANALTGIGLVRGDRVCVLAYNCLEWAEIYAATAIAGLIVVPINFRLVGQEIAYIVEDCGASALIVQDELISVAKTASTVGEEVSQPRSHVTSTHTVINASVHLSNRSALRKKQGRSTTLSLRWDCAQRLSAA